MGKDIESRSQFYRMDCKATQQSFIVRSEPGLDGRVDLFPVGHDGIIFIAQKEDLERGRDRVNTYQPLAGFVPIDDLTTNLR